MRRFEPLPTPLTQITSTETVRARGCSRCGINSRALRRGDGVESRTHRTTVRRAASLLPFVLFRLVCSLLHAFQFCPCSVLPACSSLVSLCSVSAILMIAACTFCVPLAPRSAFLRSVAGAASLFRVFFTMFRAMLLVSHCCSFSLIRFFESVRALTLFVIIDSFF